MNIILTILMTLVVFPLCAAVNKIVIPQQLLMQSGFNPIFVAKFALFIATLLLWTIIFGKVLKKLFRLPTIAGQIIGGIALGPSLIDIAATQFFADPLALIENSTGQIYTVFSSDLFVFFILLLSSALTVSYLMWIAGHETNMHDIWSIGLTAVCAGIFGAILPIIMTAAALYYVFGAYNWSLIQAVGVGLIFSATSVSIPVAMLFAHNKMHLKSSKATLGAAVVDDIVAVIILSVFFLSIQSGMWGIIKDIVVNEHSSSLAGAIGSMIGSLVIISFIGYYGVVPLIHFLKRRNLSHLIAPVANGIMLLFFGFSELFGGLAGITGAYFAGLFHRMGDSNHYAEKAFSPFVNAILLPLFLGSIGLQINIIVLSFFEWAIVIVLLCIAIVSKLLGCFLATVLSNFFRKKDDYKWKPLDSYLFGSAMVARGEVGLVIATILYGSQVLLSQQYVIAVVVIILTTIAAPIMLSLGFAHMNIATSSKASDLFALNIGLFPIVGTIQMFTIIIGRIEASGILKTAVQCSEGQKIVNIEGQNIKIILCPDEGILFKGDQKKINEILKMVKNSVIDDVARLSIE